MNPGLVSVIIPTYNRVHLVGNAVRSVLTQGHDAIEVLVIDDGSKDDTAEVMARDFGSDPRVRYLPKPNGGVASARNLGLREAHGEFVAFLDADDLWLPGKLKLQLACLAAFPEAGMVWTDMAAVNEAGEVLHERYLRKMYSTYKYFPTSQELFARGFRSASIDGRAAYCGDIFSPMVLGNLVHTSTVLLRRERAQKAGFFNEKFRTGEDYPFHLETCKQGPVAFVDEVTIRYAIGLADALTAPAKLIQIAVNFVETLEGTLAREGDAVSLPRAMIQARLGEAYAWAGHEHLRAGKRTEARAYFSKALGVNPLNLSMAKDFAMTFLPQGMRAKLTGLKKALQA